MQRFLQHELELANVPEQSYDIVFAEKADVWGCGDVLLTSARPAFLAHPEVARLRLQRSTPPACWAMTLGQFLQFMEYAVEAREFIEVKQAKDFVTMYDISALMVQPWSRGGLRL